MKEDFGAAVCDADADVMEAAGVAPDEFAAWGASRLRGRSWSMSGSQPSRQSRRPPSGEVAFSGVFDGSAGSKMTRFFNWDFWTYWIGLWGVLTIVFLALAVVFAAFAAVHVKRLEGRTPMRISEEIGSVKAVMHKVSKREPMSQDELDYARQIVADRASLMALCIPATLFALACFFVFGSLWYLHGATPSERTFLGLIPMLTSTNLAVRLRARARLKGRLQKMTAVPSPD